MEIPIRMYNMVQAIGKRIPGGERGGISRPVYPELAEDNRLDENPIARQPNTKIASAIQFL